MPQYPVLYSILLAIVLRGSVISKPSSSRRFLSLFIHLSRFIFFFSRHSFPKKRLFSNNEKTPPSTISDPAKLMHAPAATCPLLHACRSRTLRLDGASPRISTLTISPNSRQSHDNNASVSSSPLHSLSLSFPPATIAPKNVQLSPAPFFTYSFD